MATLYIIRGVSGSGKTTYAKELAAKVKCAHLETDMYFTFRDGDECEYRFNPSLLPKAHDLLGQHADCAAHLLLRYGLHANLAPLISGDIAHDCCEPMQGHNENANYFHQSLH
jgi:thymidylate kinase